MGHKEEIIIQVHPVMFFSLNITVNTLMTNNKSY